MRELVYLDLYGNSFYGALDQSIGYWPQIEYINLGCNFLSGTIPPYLGNLTRLVSFDIDYNLLVEGSIPRGVG